jgi:hypothetical protein
MIQDIGSIRELTSSKIKSHKNLILKVVVKENLITISEI